ncbi:MAG TPA: DNA polymerase III subunit beta [Candidatus Gastranaerophilales bacterium]|nr:DNA polymerase III subunit beta [Candidatus Gastranaerophilales bacterium]
MKFSVEKNVINNALNIVSKAAAARGIQPVLSNVLIETVENNQIKLCATDLDISIEMKIAAEISEKGSITLPAKKLNEIISKLSNEKVNFNIKGEDNVVEIKCGSSKFDIKGIAASEFPVVEYPETEDYIDIVIEPLLKAVKQTIFATATYDMNNVLSGVFCKINENTLEMAALDGNRLARVKEEIENIENKSFSVIIPSRTLKEFMNILSGVEDEKVSITVRNGQILFKLKDRFITSRLIEGQFPNYEQLIPLSNNKKATIDKNKLMSTLDRVSTMVNERTNIVKFSFNKDNLKVTADTPDLGDSCDELLVDYKNESFDIAFNYRYIQDFLKITETENVVVEMDGSLSGVLYKSEGEKEAVCLIMPVQLN